MCKFKNVCFSYTYLDGLGNRRILSREFLRRQSQVYSDSKFISVHEDSKFPLLSHPENYEFLQNSHFDLLINRRKFSLVEIDNYFFSKVLQNKDSFSVWGTHQYGNCDHKLA